MYQKFLERLKFYLSPGILFVKNYWEKVPPQFKKVFKVAGIVFGFFILLLIVFSIAAGTGKRRTAIVNNPVSSEAPQEASLNGEKILNPSRYATDSVVLKIEDDLKSVEKELNDLEVNEVYLLPPNLDFDINFGE